MDPPPSYDLSCYDKTIQKSQEFGRITPCMEEAVKLAFMSSAQLLQRFHEKYGKCSVCAAREKDIVEVTQSIPSQIRIIIREDQRSSTALPGKYSHTLIASGADLLTKVKLDGSLLSFTITIIHLEAINNKLVAEGNKDLILNPKIGALMEAMWDKARSEILSTIGENLGPGSKSRSTITVSFERDDIGDLKPTSCVAHSEKIIRNISTLFQRMVLKLIIHGPICEAPALICKEKYQGQDWNLWSMFETNCRVRTIGEPLYRPASDNAQPGLSLKQEVPKH